MKASAVKVAGALGVTTGDWFLFGMVALFMLLGAIGDLQRKSLPHVAAVLLQK